MTMRRLDDSVAARYTVYELRMHREPVTSEDILALCELVSETQKDGLVMREFRADAVAEFLDDCKELIGVSQVGSFVYVEYVTSEDCRVCLTYASDGIWDKAIADMKGKRVVYISRERCMKYFF